MNACMEFVGLSTSIKGKNHCPKAMGKKITGEMVWPALENEAGF